MNYDESVMLEALVMAEDAMRFGEIPVACILLDKDGQKLASSQTMVRRKGSIAAHGELFAILEAGDRIWSAMPMVLYTTLEPCLMCLGACAQAEIDTVFFAMRAKPDGAGDVASSIAELVANIPTVSGGHLEERSVELFRIFRRDNPESPGTPYVNEMLAHYESR